MHRKTLQVLSCPSCRCSYQATSHYEVAEHIIYGYLLCNGCGIVIPIAESFALFTEPLLHTGAASYDELKRKALHWFGEDATYQHYRTEKLLHGTMEIYAAFQPFNESTRAVYPLLPYVSPKLTKESYILDTWGRTGWSGEWLAGQFPDQHIITLWEGNNSVLGYRGYSYWLKHNRRSENLDVIFTDPNRPLPFATGSFDFLHALDSLHRYALFPFASECLRVTKVDAPIIFAHLHLTNSKPEPFFERGCNQFHGSDYRAWLDKITDNKDRAGWCLSESDLFEGSTPATLKDVANTEHYNGVIALFPKGHEPQKMPENQATRFLLNPLFTLDLNKKTASVMPGLHGNLTGDLLERHPVYKKRLPVNGITLDKFMWFLICMSVIGKTNQQILAACHFSKANTALDSLCKSELLIAAPISNNAHELARFHANQIPSNDPYIAFIKQLFRSQLPMIQLEDESYLHGNELDNLSAAFKASMADLNLKSGCWITINITNSPLALVLAIVATVHGINVRMTNEELCSDSILYIHPDHVQPQLLHGRVLQLGTQDMSGSLLEVLSSHMEETVQNEYQSGEIEIHFQNYNLHTTVADLTNACHCIQLQMAKGLYLFSGNDVFYDLLNLIFAVSSQTPLKFVRT